MQFVTLDSEFKGQVTHYSLCAASLAESKGQLLPSQAKLEMGVKFSECASPFPNVFFGVAIRWILAGRREGPKIGK